MARISPKKQTCLVPLFQGEVRASISQATDFCETWQTHFLKTKETFQKQFLIWVSGVQVKYSTRICWRPWMRLKYLLGSWPIKLGNAGMAKRERSKLITMFVLNTWQISRTTHLNQSWYQISKKQASTKWSWYESKQAATLIGLSLIEKEERKRLKIIAAANIAGSSLKNPTILESPWFTAGFWNLQTRVNTQNLNGSALNFYPVQYSLQL